MTKVKVEELFKNIKLAVDTNDNILAVNLEKRILGLTVIENYYIVKAYKEACSINNTDSYYDFAKMMVQDKEIYKRVLRELYADGDMGDEDVSRDGMGNIEAYVNIAKTIF